MLRLTAGAAATAVAAALCWFAARTGNGAFGVPQAHRAASAPLVATNGRALRLASGPRLVVFGYVGCADQCPLALRALSEAVAAVPPARRALVTFVDVDPWNDTQAAVARYVEHFPGVEGATGDVAALGGNEGALGVRPIRAANEVAAHDTRIFALDRDGVVVDTLAASATQAEVRRAIEATQR